MPDIVRVVLQASSISLKVPTCQFHPYGSSGERSSSDMPSIIGFLTDSCCRMDTLTRRHFLKNVGGSLGGLKFPAAAFFVSSLALSFGEKSRCPGTQWICKSTTFLDLAVSCHYWCQACWKVVLFCSQSWHW